MKRIYHLILVGTLVVTILSGFSVPHAVAANDTVLQQAQELFQTGKLNQSLAVLRNFVQQSPDSAESARASALIGRIFLQQHNYADALLYLQRVPVIFHSPEIELLLGSSLVKTGKYRAGLQKLQPLLSEPLSPSDKMTLYQMLSVASTKDQQFLLALFYLQQQLPFALNPAEILAQAHQLLQSSLSDADLEEAAFMWQETAIGQDALLQLARRALVQQQPDLARQHLQKLFASSATFPYWQEAELLLQRTSIDNSWLSRDSVGVLLPLSGRYASYGELVKKGLELALQEHNKTRLPARFIYRDTAQEGVTATQLISSLTNEDRVMAVIGPLLGKTAGEAAHQAQREMIPLLTMAQTDGLPEIGDFIFRDTLTAKQQVKSLVDFAMKHGDISFSVLRPENRLGEKMAELFVAEVQKSGGEIIDVVSYSEESTDFRKQIQQLLWEDREIKIPKKKTQIDEKEEPPKLEYPLAPFHALFIPDYADRISQIAPQLMFYGVKNVTLLGINGWNSPELGKQIGRFLKKAVFVDAFFPSSREPEVQRFVELYRQAYQEDPTILGAQAFDIATLLLQIIDDSTVKSRGDLRRKLVELNDYRGVTGTTGFDLYGEAIKQLHLLRVKSGRIVEIR